MCSALRILLPLPKQETADRPSFCFGNGFEPSQCHPRAVPAQPGASGDIRFSATRKRRSNPSPAARKLQLRLELFSFVFNASRVFREARKTRKNGFDDYADDYRILKIFNVSLHPIRAGVLHFLADVAVNVQSKGRRGVPHVVLNGFYIVSVLQRKDGIGMT